MSWADECNCILRKYAKPAVHMRAQHKNRRLSLILGSGVSKPLGVPDWDELVKRIAGEVQGETLIAAQEKRSSITSRIQLLFEHFQKRERASGAVSQGLQSEWNIYMDPRIKRRWQEIVQKELYKTVQLTNSGSVVSSHPYLGAFIDVIRDSPMTVNYNFDDFIERMLSEYNQAQQNPIKFGYESVWDINLQYKSNSSIIYHPNGYLPSDPLEKWSDWLVFAEDEYADQLIYSMTGYFSSLAHHLSKSTCLLIGLSLQDSTLRHLLRQSAKINPGHYHYYIEWVDDGQQLDPAVEDSVRTANFEVYNLITLFLTNKEIKALGDLITMNDSDFKFNVTENGHKIKYCFYISGAIGAGKSTVISYFHSLQTHDEWTERRPLVLAKYSGDLSEQETQEADNWIASQFNRKNYDLCESNEGIHIVDRPPLDPLGFTKEEEWPNKADLLLDKICRGERRVEPGRVILLTCEPKVLETRIKPPQLGYTSELLEEQQKGLSNTYTGLDGVKLIDTTHLTVDEAVKMVARIIHMQEYEPLAKLHERLEEIRGGENVQ